MSESVEANDFLEDEDWELPGVVAFNTGELKKQLENAERKLKDQSLVHQKETEGLEEKVVDAEKDVKRYSRLYHDLQNERDGKVQKLQAEIRDLEEEVFYSRNGLSPDRSLSPDSPDLHGLRRKLVEAEERWVTFYHVIQMFLHMVSHGGLNETQKFEAEVIHHVRRWLQAPPHPIWVKADLMSLSSDEFLQVVFGVGKWKGQGEEPESLTEALSKAQAVYEQLNAAEDFPDEEDDTPF